MRKDVLSQPVEDLASISAQDFIVNEYARLSKEAKKWGKVVFTGFGIIFAGLGVAAAAGGAAAGATIGIVPLIIATTLVLGGGGTAFVGEMQWLYNRINRDSYDRIIHRQRRNPVQA